VSQLTSDSFEVEIINSVDNTSYPVPFSIKRKDIALSEIVLTLKFPQPSNVSISNEPDRLRVRSSKKIQILRKNVCTILDEGLSAEANIPR
jgi:hypothetical protein